MGLFKIEAEYFGGDVVVIAPTKLFLDDRGFNSIPYRADEFRELGLPMYFVQDSHSQSRRNVIRGLHFQLNPGMGKLMRVTRGEAWIVTVDIRPTSPTFLKWVGIQASEYNQIQIWAPANFARGFCALDTIVDVQYKCTAFFDAKGDAGIRWDDPDIRIKWPFINHPILSERDLKAPTAREYFEGVK